MAENETVFRAGNEAITANRPAVAGDELRMFICECGLAGCFERIALTTEEYEAIRADPTWFFVVPGHEDLSAGEVVVKDSKRYAVVEKRGDGREIAERNDPRAA